MKECSIDNITFINESRLYMTPRYRAGTVVCHRIPACIQRLHRNIKIIPVQTKNDPAEISQILIKSLQRVYPISFADHQSKTSTKLIMED